MKNYCAFLYAISFMMHLNATPTYSVNYTEDHTCEITLDFALNPNATIYGDSLKLSIDHPDIELVSWHPNYEPTTKYDESFKENKQVFTKNFSITARAKSKSGSFPSEAYLHCAYYTSENKKMCEDVFPLAAPLFDTPAPETQTLAKADIPTSVETTAVPKEKTLSFSERLSNLVETTDSLALRLLLVLVLGLLMSLTPCIYPMIPITVGILQGQAKQSFIYNFFIALSYTIGISTTFASLGFSVAFAGKKVWRAHE